MFCQATVDVFLVPFGDAAEPSQLAWPDTSLSRTRLALVAILAQAFSNRGRAGPVSPFAAVAVAAHGWDYIVCLHSGVGALCFCRHLAGGAKPGFSFSLGDGAEVLCKPQPKQPWDRGVDGACVSPLGSRHCLHSEVEPARGVSSKR
eukprot:1133696-Amphidinium_carterae.1